MISSGKICQSNRLSQRFYVHIMLTFAHSCDRISLSKEVILYGKIRNEPQSGQ